MTDNVTEAKPAIPTAAELRMQLLKEQMKEIEAAEKAKEAKKKALDEFTHSFLRDHISEEERAMVRRVVANAVSNGQMEAMIYSFPSDLCTDSGRAINNADPEWPETLRGKAKEIYDLYKQNVQPQGFRLKAMIINFPGGIPGDVGFFLNWAPPVTG